MCLFNYYYYYCFNDGTHSPLRDTIIVLYLLIFPGVQEKLGIMNNGLVYSVFSYSASRSDELSFDTGARLQVLRKGDDNEREWWWCRDDAGNEGYVPRNLLGVSFIYVIVKEIKIRTVAMGSIPTY